MPKKVQIFTTSTCASCAMVKRWLQTKGILYTEVNLDTNPERQAEALSLSGVLSVPITIITKQDDSQQVVIGYNLAQLAGNL